MNEKVYIDKYTFEEIKMDDCDCELQILNMLHME